MRWRKENRALFLPCFQRSDYYEVLKALAIDLYVKFLIAFALLMMNDFLIRWRSDTTILFAYSGFREKQSQQYGINSCLF
jgi:hypothetical protein